MNKQVGTILQSFNILEFNWPQVVSRVDDQSQHLNRIILNQSHVEINLLLENILLDCTADKVSDVAG